MIKRYLIFLGVIPVVVLLGALVVKDLDPAIAWENGVLENIQIGFALLASVAFIVQLGRIECRFRGILWGGFFFGLVCAFREFDARPIDSAPQWVLLLGTDLGRDITIGVLLVSFLFFVGRSLYRLKWMVLGVSKTWFGLFLISAAVAILLGDVFEKKIFGGKTAQLFEEYLETVGYILLFCSALAARSLRSVEEK